MAWPMSPTLAAAVASPDRVPVSRLYLWLDGDSGTGQEMTHLQVDWKIERTPDDTPEQVSRFAGSIAASASITIAWLGPAFPGDGRAMTRDLAAYVGTRTGVRDRDFGIGMKVRLDTGFQTSAGPETIRRFIGRVDTINVADDSSLTLGCLDYSADLQTTVSLPPAAVADNSPGIPTYMVAELLLRTGGFHRTPPPLSDCVLSVPSLLPEIGEVAAPLQAEPNPAPNLGAYPAPSYDNTYSATASLAQVTGGHVIIEGFFRTANIAATRTLVKIGGTTGGGITLTHTSANALRLATMADTTIGQSAASVLPSDGGWHYLCIDWYVGFKIDFRIDNTTRTVGAGLFPGVDVDTPQVTIGGLVHEGVSIRYVPPGLGDVQVWRNTWVPNYGVDYRGVSPTIRAIPRGQQGTVLELLRGIATATGAVFRWREDGAWRWEERTSWVERRVAATVADHDHTRTLLSSGYSYNGASRRSEVTVDWTEYTLTRSTLTAPAWEATDVITVGPQRTDILDFETDQPILGLLPIIRSSVQTAGSSVIQTVPAYQVGDPAAQIVTGVRTRILPTATGFRAVITNTGAQAIAFWDPATGGPAFRVRGWTVTGGDPRRYTQKSSPRSLESLVLPESPWRQDRRDAVAMCQQIAAETALPAVIFEQQRVVSDPSETVDDVVRLWSPDIMNGLVPAQIVGMTETDVELTLTVRACYPPVGLVLGVAGRNTIPDNMIAV